MELIQTKTYCEKWPSGCLMCDLLLCDGKKMVGAKPYKPMTNADRIRSMTDEEIEEWYWRMHKEMMYYTDSRAFVHDWLISTASDYYDDNGHLLRNPPTCKSIYGERKADEHTD